MHLLAHSAGVHTCHTPDCMILVPVLLTWHSALYNRHPLHTIATYKQNQLVTSGGLGMVTGSIPDICCSFH
jgi:hypothetical protein